MCFYDRNIFVAPPGKVDNGNCFGVELAPLAYDIRQGMRAFQGRQDSFGNSGNRKFLKSGLLSIQVFTAIDEATNVNDTLCQQVQDLFEGVRIDDIWFYDGGIRFSGAENEWFQQNVVFDFDFEDVK